MDKVFERTDRISDVIKREVALVLSREVADPRLRFVTVTHVRVTKDLRNARVFFHTLSGDEELKEVKKALKKAAGFVQRKLSGRLQIRVTPHLAFVYDTSMDSGTHMDGIFKKIDDELKTKEH